MATFFQEIIGSTFVLSRVITNPLSFLPARANFSLSWVCSLTIVPPLSCIYASLQHLFFRWIDLAVLCLIVGYS
jgi:hypothetical protein